MQEFISFSGGVESRTMCVLFGAKADAIFADTLFEHERMYEEIEEFWEKIKTIHPKFKVIRIVGKRKYKGVEYEGLKNYIKASKFYPSPRNRYCTADFKITPIDNFLSQFEESSLMIGLNYDERDDRVGNYGLVQNVNYSYPLIDLGITRNRCLEILHKMEIAPNFPAYMRRGGCQGCFYKSKKEYEALALLNEREYDEVAYLEQEIQDRRGRFYSISNNVGSLREAKKLFKAKLFSNEEMYPSILQEKTPCGVFCHR